MSNKKENKKTPKKRSNKYQKKLSLYGMDEKKVIKRLLETPSEYKADEEESK